MDIDLKILLSAILFLLCQLPAEAADRKGGSITYANENVKSASRTSGLSDSLLDYRSMMKDKFSSVHYSTPTTPTATEKGLDESFPDQVFASGFDLESEGVGNMSLSKLQESKNDTEDSLYLGVETTSVNPFHEEDNTDRPELEQARQVETEEDDRGDVVAFNQLDDKQHTSSSRSKSRVKAAVVTKHSFEYRPIKIQAVDHEAIHEPKIIEVEAKSMPLEIHFKSASSRIKVVQSHKPLGELNDVQRTSSNEQPQRIFHTVTKPIISEVREIIIPHRKIIQEIRPVQEQVHTVVSHESDESRQRLLKLKQDRAAKQQQTSKTEEANKKQTRPAPSSEQQSRGRVSPQSYGAGNWSSKATVSKTQAKNEVTQSTYDAERSNEQDYEDMVEDAVSLVGGKDFSAIIPARLMNRIISQYGLKTKPRTSGVSQQQVGDKNETYRPVQYDDEPQVVTQQRLESGKLRGERVPPHSMPISPAAKLSEQQNRARHYVAVNIQAQDSNNLREKVNNHSLRERGQMGSNQASNSRLAQRPPPPPGSYQSNQQIQQLREAESRRYAQWQSRHNVRLPPASWGSMSRGVYSHQRRY